MYLKYALRLGLFMSLPGLALSSCNSDGLGGYSSSGGECDPGQLRCFGSEYQLCGNDGIYATTVTCSSSSVCDDRLGCVACTPGGNTCGSSTEVHSCNDDGSVGALVSTCNFGETCKVDQCVDSCEVAASEFVYLVDSANNLLSFEPRRDTDDDAIKPIGTLNCSQTATPFSMAVDRKARAWVLYNDGNIFFVSPADASCSPSGYVTGQGGFPVFGMGFVSDFQGSKTEQLYVGNNLGGTKGLARIDPTSLMLTKFADFPMGVNSSPEMTGTGNAEWYGYFPSATEGEHIIVRMNKSTGAFETTWQLPPLPGGPSAWAFAHWGGRYYQFVSSGGKNQVRRYDPTTQQNVIVQDSTPYVVVGAGVSTCAPVVPG